MPRLTRAAVNHALATQGHAERLVQGRGYWYFAEGATPCWPASSVYVPRLTDLSLDEWLAEHRALAAAAR